jgi:protein involved in polysaccharide export with SLBB domain
MTVLKAVSLAGGPTERGALNRAKIRRVVNGQTVELRARENDLVKADDIITIPQRIW